MNDVVNWDDFVRDVWHLLGKHPKKTTTLIKACNVYVLEKWGVDQVWRVPAEERKHLLDWLKELTERE